LNVFRSVQRHSSRHNEVIFHAEARCSSREVLQRVFQLWQELQVWLAQRIPTHYPLILRQFLAIFESEFSVMDRAAICIWGNWLGLFACSCNNAKQQDTAHVALKLMKVNLAAHEVGITHSMNIKNQLIYCGCSRWISSASCEKCDFNSVSGRFS